MFMKRLLLPAFFCGILLAFSCAKESPAATGSAPAQESLNPEESAPVPGPRTVTLQLLPPGEEPSLAENARQEAAATRTVLSGNKVKWVEGDKIRVNGTEYTVSLSDDALSATVEVEEADAYYAFYPSEWVSAYTDGVYTFTVPDRQDGFVSDGTTDGASFVNKANPMYAYSTSAHLNMTFHHFFGILQLQLTRTEAAEQVFSRMELKSNNQGTALSGAGFTIAPADGSLVRPASSAAVSLTGIWSVGNWGNRIYTFVVPAGTYSGGVCFDLYDGNSKLIRSYGTDKAVTITAGKSSHLKVINIDASRTTYKTRTGEDWSATVSDLSSLDLTGISELVVETSGAVRLNDTELAAIATAIASCSDPIILTLGNAALAGNADGKRIFPSVFSGNAKLGVINLPANVGELTYDAFNGCTALTEVKFESGLYWIGDRAFSGCTSLRSIISYAATPPAMGSDNIFYNLPSDGTLSCPDASAYQDASSPDNKYWYQLKNEKNWTIIQQ